MGGILRPGAPRADFILLLFYFTSLLIFLSSPLFLIVRFGLFCIFSPFCFFYFFFFSKEEEFLFGDSGERVSSRSLGRVYRIIGSFEVDFLVGIRKRNV